LKLAMNSVAVNKMQVIVNQRGEIKTWMQLLGPISRAF